VRSLKVGCFAMSHELHWK